MRFGYVLLGMVTLTSIHTLNGRCSNGLKGVQTDDICCEDGCGKCGGNRCNKRPGGSDSCCTSKIRNSGRMCSNTHEAPCIVRSVCDKGYPGVQKDDICCDAACGTCGGSGCSSRPGGSDACCSSRIWAIGQMCDTTRAGPCIMNGPTFVPAPTDPGEPSGQSLVPTIAPIDAATEAPTPRPTVIPVLTCSNGFPGVGDGSICCELQCGTCGGSGCSGRPGGKAGCCSSAINMSEVMCSEALAAPCIIDN